MKYPIQRSHQGGRTILNVWYVVCFPAECKRIFKRTESRLCLVFQSLFVDCNFTAYFDSAWWLLVLWGLNMCSCDSVVAWRGSIKMRSSLCKMGLKLRYSLFSVCLQGQKCQAIQSIHLFGPEWLSTITGWIFLETFRFPRRWILIVLVILWFLIQRYSRSKVPTIY